MSYVQKFLKSGLKKKLQVIIFSAKITKCLKSNFLSLRFRNGKIAYMANFHDSVPFKPVLGK